MSTQVLLQAVWPPVQLTGVWQLPDAQTWPLPHACPQEPQLLVLVCVFTQVLSQIVFEQLVHWPAEQYWPVAQTLPHVPQLLTSVCRL